MKKWIEYVLIACLLPAIIAGLLWLGFTVSFWIFVLSGGMTLDKGIVFGAIFWRIYIVLLVIGLICIILNEVQINKLESAAIKVAKEYINKKYGDELRYLRVKQWKTRIVFGESYWNVFFIDKKKKMFHVRVRQKDEIPKKHIYHFKVFRDLKNVGMYVESEN
ncbi:MAG: hypothetical protein IJA32_15240 [Lachnospiraceae bacterium]|nr:hypothetical protein [Lachnospiraceae bacterium]